MKRYWIDLSGTVQGVGFRWFASQNARRLGLTGFVCNLDNGHVRIEVQGPPAAIDQFLARILAGNGHSEIAQADVQAIDIQPGEHGFEIDPC